MRRCQMGIGTCQLCGVRVVWNSYELSAHMEIYHGTSAGTTRTRDSN